MARALEPGIDARAVRLLHDAGGEIALMSIEVLHDGGNGQPVPMGVEIKA